MAVSWLWGGAATSTGFTVRAKVSGESPRLAVSTTGDLDDPTYFAATPADGIATLVATGLDPGRRYYYAVEDGTLDERVGQIRTAPVGPASTLRPQ